VRLVQLLELVALGLVELVVAPLVVQELLALLLVVVRILYVVQVLLVLLLVRLRLVVLAVVLLKEEEEVRRNLLLPLLVLNADTLVLVELEGFLALYLLNLRRVEIVQLIRL